MNKGAFEGEEIDGFEVGWDIVGLSVEVGVLDGLETEGLAVGKEALGACVVKTSQISIYYSRSTAITFFSDGKLSRHV